MTKDPHLWRTNICIPEDGSHVNRVFRTVYFDSRLKAIGKTSSGEWRTHGRSQNSLLVKRNLKTTAQSLIPTTHNLSLPDMHKYRDDGDGHRLNPIRPMANKWGRQAPTGRALQDTCVCCSTRVRIVASSATVSLGHSEAPSPRACAVATDVNCRLPCALQAMAKGPSLHFLCSPPALH